MSEMPELLRVLKRADAGLEAGPEVEARVLVAFRRRRAVRAWKRGSALAAVAAAAVLALIPGQRHPASQSNATVAEPVNASVAAAVAPAEAPEPTRTERPVRVRRVTPPLREIATDFFPLIDTPPPFERGELVRVVLPAAAMRKVGIPVSENHLADPVQADVLVGQEGLARAIRFKPIAKTDTVSPGDPAALNWGKIVFQWLTSETPATNNPAAGATP